jgi:small subunit ribosomal protein S4
MNNYIGPKLRLSKRLSVAIAETPKHVDAVEAGQKKFGRFRRRQKSLYGRQLDEKQKLAFYYNIGNKQLRRYLKDAQKSKGSTADALMVLVDRRLDNVLRRLGWARTIWQARQLVVHGHVLVNGKKCDRPGFLVSVNDTITPKEKSRELIQTCASSVAGRTVPGWLTGNESTLEGQVIREPLLEDIQLPFDLDCSMIVEFFSK